MPIITFTHHKGGTGKTTSCLNIAGALVDAGKKVLVVDCDPQANATMGLGIFPDSQLNPGSTSPLQTSTLSGLSRLCTRLMNVQPYSESCSPRWQVRMIIF